jgi:hypothetical protein
MDAIMRRIPVVLALLLAGAAGTAEAQSALRIKPYVGAFAPSLPVVSVGDGRNPDVELESAPVMGVELEVVPRHWLRVYGGVAYAAPRMNLSGAMRLEEVDGSSVRTTLLLPTAGVVLSPSLGSRSLRPSLRLGLGAKRYTFDMARQRDAVTDLTGDLGIGISAGEEGPVSLSAEARWLPSRFDGRNLPMPVVGGGQQDQNDWLFQLAFRFRP